jgi:uncharacterized RDD family membrane protein YckC
MSALSGVEVPAPPAPAGARCRASLLDYLAILGWLAVLTVVGFAVRSVLPPALAEPTYSPLVADAAALVLTVLPVWAYLTAAEASPLQGSWGKRRAGLRVVSAHGQPVTWRRAAVRNAVKLAPWQLAHVAVARIILEVDAPATIALTYSLSLLIPLVSIAIAWRDPLHRALHDRAAGTCVTFARPPVDAHPTRGAK